MRHPPSRIRSGGAPERAGLSGVVSNLGSFVSQIAVLTALLYYFGWARTAAIYDYFSINTNITGYSTSDYVLRSAQPVFAPALFVALLMLALAIIHHHLVIPVMDSWRNGRRLTIQVVRVFRWTSLPVLLLVAICVLLQLQVGANLGVILPCLLVAGAVIHLYSDSLISRFRLGRLSRDGARQAAASPVRRAALYALALVGMFWAFGVYARDSGTEAAHRIAQNVAGRPNVILYAAQRLEIRGPGVTVDVIEGPDSRYRFRYNGLCLLVKPPARYILLPLGWQKGRDSTVIIPDDDSIRIDIQSGP
jgi:hypothetical protein